MDTHQQTHSERSHYLCTFQLDGRSSFVVWYSDAKDGLLMEDGHILCFQTSVEAGAYLAAHNLRAESAPVASYDFDRIGSWCSTRYPDGIDCGIFLNVWNMFLDVAENVEDAGEFLEADANLLPVYEKLFAGNNLPAVTPSGALYVPIWNHDEVERLASLFTLGLSMARRALSAR